MTLLARIISVIFHPLLIGTYMFMLFAVTFPVAFDPIRDESAWNFILLVFFATFLLPVFNVFLFRGFGTIQSISMISRRERIIPFTFVALLYLLATFLFFTRAEVSMDDNFLKFMMVIDALVCVAVIATYFYKISVHALGMAGLAGILLPLNRLSDSEMLFHPTLIVIVLAGVVMSARLKLNVHSPREVLIGAMLGLSTSLVFMDVFF